MGRQLRRVPLDFSHPVNKTWPGYLCPYNSTQCRSCGGGGYNKATKRIYDDWYGFDNPQGGWGHNITQLEADALWEQKRLWDFKEKPTAEQVNQWSRHGFGHDSINAHICVRARAESLELYGKCLVCGGSGQLWSSPEVKALADAWERTDPPTGDGYQMWQTVSEGSPISPVFSDIIEMCVWLGENGAPIFGTPATTQEWITFCKHTDWMPSMLIKDGKIQTIDEIFQEEE